MVKGEGDNPNIETHRGQNNHVMMNQDENLNADDNEGEINSDVESVFTYGDEDVNEVYMDDEMNIDDEVILIRDDDVDDECSVIDECNQDGSKVGFCCCCLYQYIVFCC